jgi:FMN phosphatase YigB (HAD superfamily)
VTLAILLDFDGTAYRGDLAVQAYARRVAELLDSDTGMFVIAGMRSFLEGMPRPPGMPPEFDNAEDGFELVHALSDAAGLPAAIRRQAYRASRDDLARSAFALDPVPGLADWLAEVKPESRVWVATNAPMAGIREVLDAVDLISLVDEIIPGADKPHGMHAITERAIEVAGRPERLVAIGDRWAADLAAAAAAGGRTAHLDRYGRGLGSPTWRNAEFSPLLPALRQWAADPEGWPRAH